ncbi:hypothetical protein [Aegicerativicinus sediminis]|uniref:hypothetical protein n=1 Tax=Aegicerativicinus sediminis TaxID=2893202 RepID=UPI001E4A9694|nr:hypothetical protein [Aegicerativicinus sediminis]
MKLISIKRQTKSEGRYSKKMGSFQTKVTYIQKAILSIPYKTLHSYRETYYGEVKDCEACNLAS